MDSIILKIQEDIISSKFLLSDLLRKSLLVAKKLDLKDFEEWILRELNGYSVTDEVPSYRIIKGQLKAQTVFGIKPVLLNSKMEEKIGKQQVLLSIVELECFVGNDPIYLHLPGEAQKALAACFNSGESCIFIKVFSPSQIVLVLDQVKIKLLEFIVNLEKQGILGEGIMFSENEKKKAKDIVTNNYFNAPIRNLQMQQDTVESYQSINVTSENGASEDLDKILGEIRNLGLHVDEKEELYAELQTIKFQLQSSNPKNSILNESWNTAKNILEGVMAGLISSGLVGCINKIDHAIKSIIK